MVPYLVTCMAFIILSAVKNIVVGRTGEIIKEMLLWGYAGLYGSGNPYTEPFYIKSIGAIWFLPAMLWACTIYNMLMDKRWCLGGVIILAVIGYTTVKYIYLPWSIQSAMLALVFIHAGQWFRKRGFLENNNLLWLIAAIILWLGCMYIGCGRFYLVGNYSQHLLTDIVGGIAGSFVVLKMSQAIEYLPRLGSALGWFGRNSLIVLCVHLTELTFFPWNRLWNKIGILGGILTIALTIFGKLVWAIMGVWIILIIKNRFDHSILRRQLS